MHLTIKDGHLVHMYWTLLVICITTRCYCVTDDQVLSFSGPCSQVTECCALLRRDTFPNLNMKYNCSEPGNVTIATDIDSSQPARLFLNNTCITSLPYNLCQFPNIVSIYMPFNKIQSIPSLSCLSKLVAVDLSYNEIRTVGNTSFTHLKRLRYIDLQFNQIWKVQVRTFESDLENLKIVKLDHNELETVEAKWMMSITHHFCVFDISYNKITRFSNEEKWHASPGETYGPGFVNFSHNLFTRWIDEQLKLFHFSDFQSLGILMNWGFDFRENPWQCDCHMYDFLSFVSNFHTVIHRDYFKAHCNEPAVLKGKLIKDVKLSELVCDVTTSCPTGCTCQDRPHEDIILVDCKNGELDSLPERLPKGNLKLEFGNNSITKLEPRYYLSTTKYIDLSENSLTEIHPLAISSLKSASFVNLSFNAITHLPDTIVTLSFSHIILDHNNFICSCNMVWLATWLQHQTELDALEIQCTFEGTKIPAWKANEIFLGCRKRNPFPIAISILLGLVCAVFVTCVVIAGIFRYELLITFYLHLIKYRKTMSPYDADHDIFISVDSDSDIDRIWVGKTLIPELEEKRGLKVYFPPRDMDPGSIITDETIKVLNRCNISVVILSQSYAENPSKMYEFTEAFNIIVKRRLGRMVLLKRPDVKYVSNRYMKGFLRLNQYVDIDNDSVFDTITGKCASYMLPTVTLMRT